MKAAVFVEKEKIEIQDIPRPEIQSGEVLLKVEFCGVCGSDVHANKSGQLYSQGCYGFTADDFNSVINYMSDIRLDTDRMISEIIALEDIVEKGFKELLASSEKLKILVKP